MRKEGPNKGKPFWTCATYPFCKFFLWRDEAIIRESGFKAASDAEGANDQSVPPRPKTPTFTQRPLESYGIQATPSRQTGTGSDLKGVSDAVGTSFTSTQTVRETQSSSSVPSPSKRKRNDKDTWDQDDSSDLDSDEERQLAEIVDKSAEKLTPRRAVGDIFTTPVTDRRTADIVGGLPTPSVCRTLFPPSEAKRSKTVSFDEPSSSETPATPAKTPTSRPTTVNPDGPSSSPAGADAQNVADEVMELLGDQKIDPGVLRSVHELLLKAARQTKGISLGRDSARAALKEKDKKIARLQDKIRDLEVQHKYDAREITDMKAEMMRIYESH